MLALTEFLEGGVDSEAEETIAGFLFYFGFLRSSDPAIAEPFADGPIRDRVRQALGEGSFAGAFTYALRQSALGHPEIRSVLEPALLMLLAARLDAVSLGRALDVAALLAQDRLLSYRGWKAICATLEAAGPFWAQAPLLVEPVQKLLRASTSAPGTVIAPQLLIDSIRDEGLREALRSR